MEFDVRQITTTEVTAVSRADNGEHGKLWFNRVLGLSLRVLRGRGFQSTIASTNHRSVSRSLKMILRRRRSSHPIRRGSRRAGGRAPLGRAGPPFPPPIYDIAEFAVTTDPPAKPRRSVTRRTGRPLERDPRRNRLAARRRAETTSNADTAELAEFPITAERAELLEFSLCAPRSLR